jgi:hypothetical protein
MLAKNRLNSVGGVYGELVLPHTYDEPSCGLKCGVVPPVARDVSVKLRRPVVRVGARIGLVVRTLVPEAAIHEDRHPCLREDDVRTATESGHGLTVLAEP